MACTEVPTKLATYASSPPGVKAMPNGWLSVSTVAMTVLVAVAITETAPTPGVKK